MSLPADRDESAHGADQRSLHDVVESMYEVAEVEIASALDYAHARAAALIAEAEAEAEAILVAARLGLREPEIVGLAPLGPAAKPTRRSELRSTPWTIPLDAILPMLALVLVLVVALAWMG